MAAAIIRNLSVRVRKRRQVSSGSRRHFFATMDAEVIKALKSAALEDDVTASEILEEAARDLLARRKAERDQVR